MFGTQNRVAPQDGDTVMLYAGKASIASVTLKAGETFCHRFGAFRHNDIIGEPFWY
jgi:tRNA A58 N-methylase Trm61